MNSKRIVLGIGIVLLVLAVLTAHAAAHKAYFVPQHGNATIGNTTEMNAYVDIDAGETLLSGQIQLEFDPTCAKVTDNYMLCQYVNPTGEGQYCWTNYGINYDSERNGSMWNTMYAPQVSKHWDPPGPDPLGWYWDGTPDGLIHGPATVPIGLYVVEAYGTHGVSPFNFGFAHFPEYCPACQKSKFANGTGIELSINWENGTFTHLAGPVIPETFTKPLVSGWNLISLPLTPTDNSTSAVLGNATIVYDTVKSYNTATHQFEDATTMDPGIGYFVHVTTEGDWVYEGTAYTSISATLSTGLNCVGWMNETGSALPDALSSIGGSYRYVAHWNATSQSYEVYLPGAPAVFNDFATMDRGEGYFIAATAGCTLMYP